jgi:ABC-2 type transport system ATP-binding protein
MPIPAIDITDLTKYYGKNRGIENVNLKIGEGEVFGFIGPNGAGKSATIRILLNLIFPSHGSARIMGMDVVRETKKIKQYTGYIPSDATAYHSMNVNEFLDYCMRFHGKNTGNHRKAELCSLFDLDLKRKIADLSMGNRKKVSIIQSLLHSPRLLIVDEPTTGLDPLMQAQFFEVLRLENRKGMTIFFSSHILNEVQLLCKRVAIIKEGKIIQLEDIETLRKRQLKKVTIEYADPGDAKNIHFKGLNQMIAISGNIISFVYDGNINELTAFLSRSSLINLTIEEPSLEEIFMHYYQ